MLQARRQQLLKGISARGHLEVLQWAHASGCDLTSSTCAAAARGGHLEVLKWARSAGCEWNVETCSGAAAGGHLHILQYARSRGCAWTYSTCYSAAYHGRLQLQWAHASGCPFHPTMYSAAARAGHVHGLQWLRDEGRRFDPSACTAAVEAGRLDTLQWLRARGCPLKVPMDHAMEEDRIRVFTPTGSSSQQEIVHLVSDSTKSVILYRLLEDISRRRIRCLTLDGDFTGMQQRPLSLPPSLVQLELNGFRGELGPTPPSLQRLYLCAFREIHDEANIPHPLLTDIDDGDAVQRFLQEAAQIVEAMLPTLRSLHLCGLRALDSECIRIRACVRALWGLSHPHLEYFGLLDWTLCWADLVPLLSSPAVAELDVEFCTFSDDGGDAIAIPWLPEGLSSLSVRTCFSEAVDWVFRELPRSLRHLLVLVDNAESGIVFQHPLPPLLESLVVENEGHVSVTARVLPAGLCELQVGGFQLERLGELPPRLRELTLRRYQHRIPPLPDTLETLVLDGCTHHAVDVPDSVRSLSLYWHMPRPAPPLPARWPARLECLVYWAIGASDDAPEPCIDRLLPPTLTELELSGCTYLTDLPQALQILHLGRGFSQQLQLAGSFTVNVNSHKFRND
ncbi:hypothetical protein JKP88DRAFT_326956 [Tribonema minus]|uniref:Uncharacterized protein n=1 Tax=Tribonema minus TaxID=303371 RepID=A0A835YPZ1_9STRA|nr:hypothetical protein JKP88DRAFT_326956 [Tribonema minus]